MKRLFTSFLLGSVLYCLPLLCKTALMKLSVLCVRVVLHSFQVYFDDNIELTLPDKSDNYSKAQAQLIVKDFFSNNGVKGFELKHKGDSPGGHFCIGTLQTNAGNFRTNVFMKIKNGKEVVKEIRFQSIE